MAIKNVGVLAFASAAVAAGHNHYQHNHLHASGAASAPAAMPTGMPACWGSCFKEAGVTSMKELCDCTEATECIKRSCASEDSATYQQWHDRQCHAPYPVAGNSTMVGPTATTGYSSGVPSGGVSTSICTETSTLIYHTTTAYSTYLITHTLSASSSDVSVAPVEMTSSAAGAYAPSASAPAGGDDDCTDVTVTSTQRSTVTITAGNGGEASSAVSSVPAGYSSSEAVPVTSSAAPAPPSYETTSSEAAPVSSSEAPAPSSYASEAPAPSSYASEAPAPSSYVSEAPAPSSSAAAPSSYASASSTSSSKPEHSSPPTYDTGFRGKRGIAYNESSMVVPALTNSGKIGWASNWEGECKGFENSDITYIPTLHNGDSYFVNKWAAQVEAAIAAGQPYLFGPNEPDMPNQANLLPEACAQLWKDHMEIYAGRIKLVAPSVSSTDAPGYGLDWLKQFKGNCTSCTFDAYNQHWYPDVDLGYNDVDAFKKSVSDTAEMGPVFVGEFGAMGSDEDISSFMDEVMPWMDNNDSVLGYAYFMAYQGLLVNGDSLSPYGETYCNDA